VLAAHERIEPHIHRTPVLTSSYLNDLTGARAVLQMRELSEGRRLQGARRLQRGVRPDDETPKGRGTHSSGNHALSLSYAAGRRGIPCNVVMPRTAPQAKKDAVRGYGGIITECEPSTSSREAVFRRSPGKDRRDFVHPYNDPRVIAGQGTCSRELMEQTDGSTW
jgi:threonine dehydratase